MLWLSSQTLRPTENGSTAHGHSIASIPLNKLTPWDGNVRRTGASDALEELTASIAAHGVLQSLVVRKANRGKFAILAGRRRFLALSALAKKGAIACDAPVPCRIMPGSADPTEISLTENVVRAPMHPADQFEAFRELIDGGSTPVDIAARFGISEGAVKKRLKLARVSPVVFEAYRSGELTLDQVQAFTVSDDHAAQESVFAGFSQWNDDPESIRSALTPDEIAASDKRARLVTVQAYESAGGAVRRDLFSEGDDGIFLLDAALLDRLVMEKLNSAADGVRAEGWKWVEVHSEFDYEARSQFERRHPEPRPLTDEASAEQKRLVQEYDSLFASVEDDDEEASERLDAIEARINQLEETERCFTPETLSISGAVLTLSHAGEVEVIRGLVRPEDAPEPSEGQESAEIKLKEPFSAALIESLTTFRSAALSASLAKRPDVALAAVVHAMVLSTFRFCGNESSLHLTATRAPLKEECTGMEALEQIEAEWSEKLPSQRGSLWQWCLAQDRETLLELLALCAARTVSAVERKQERSDSPRLAHARELAEALSLDMTAWFVPDAANFFNRIGRSEILSCLAEAKGMKPKKSWEKLKKSELAILAEREIAGTGWLPKPMRS